MTYRPQATRCTQKQLAYLAYWRARGYQFKRGEKIPESTTIRPGFATRYPRIHAVIGTAILSAIWMFAIAAWVYVGAGLI